MEDIPKEKWDSMWQEVTSATGSAVIDEGTSYRVDVPDEMAVYFFTKPNHTAHPAVVKRSVATEGQSIELKTQAWVAGSKKEFEAWFEGFLHQDMEVRNEMDGSSDNSD